MQENVPAPPPGFVSEDLAGPLQELVPERGGYVLPPYIVEREERQKQRESEKKELLNLRGKTVEEQTKIILEASPEDLWKLSVADIKEQALDIYYRRLGGEQGLEGTPWVDPVMAPVMAGTSGAKLAAKGGVKVMAKSGLLSALSALLIEPVTGTLADEAGQQSAILAPVVGLVTGAALGTGAAKLLNKVTPIAKDTARLLKIKKIGSVSIEDFKNLVMHNPDEAIREIAKSKLPKADIEERIRNLVIGTMKGLGKGEKKLVAMNATKVIQSLHAKSNIVNQIDAIRKTGGSTFNIKGENLAGTKGFAVSIFPEHSEIIKGNITIDQLQDYYTKHSKILKEYPELSVGTWFDKKAGETYIDIAATVKNKWTATGLGRRYNQKAIFNLETMEEISTGGTGKTIADIPTMELRMKEIRRLNPLTSETKAGVVELQHWSTKKGLTEIDPTKHGTGIAGAETQRKIADPDNWVDRSYWGIKDGGYVPEAGLGTTKYETKLSYEKLYDFNNDPLNLRPAKGVKGNPISLYERAIKDEGFLGYHVSSSQKGDTAILFEKTSARGGVTSTSPLAEAFLQEFKDAKIPREKLKVGSGLWDKWIIGKGEKLLEKVPGGKTVIKALDYDYRGSLKDTAKYLHSFEDMRKAQEIGAEYAVDLGTRLNKLPETLQLKIGAVITGESITLDKAGQKLADEARFALYELGKQSVDTGLMTQETFFKNVGRYMPRLYTKHEHTGLLKQFGLSKPTRLDMSRFLKRKDIPKEIRKEMGEILTPGYPVAKGIFQLTHDISMGNFFRGIAGNSDWALAKQATKLPKQPAVEKYLQEIGHLELPKTTKIPDGWRQLPEARKLGKLNGAYVHPEIYEDLMDSIHVAELPEKIWRKSLGMWKFGKVILSPKTHMRNLFSNSILAHCGGLSMPRQPYYLAKAAKTMCRDSEYYTIAKKGGLLGNTFVHHELKGLYEVMPAEQCNPHVVYKLLNQFRKAGAGAAHVYEAEEQWFKIAKMIHNIEKRGMGNAEAIADAEKWLFNYSKLTRAQAKFRSKWYGAPFATFTFKALPRIAETAVTKPWRLILPLAMIHGLEEHARHKIGDTVKQAKAKRGLLPDWMKGSMFATSNFARVPVVDDFGREYYLNLTYMLPWGDLGEGGSFMGLPGGVMPLSQPFVREPMQQILNYDNFWDEKIVKDVDLAGKTGVDRVTTEAKARGKHLFQTMAPTPAIDALKILSAAKGEPDYKGRTRPTGVVLADVLAGVKMYPVDYAEQIQRKINKLDSTKGVYARQLVSQIRTLYRKKKASKNKKVYQKQIDQKIKQLHGLAKETKALSIIYGKTK